MIRTAGTLEPPAPRLLSALGSPSQGGAEPPTLVFGAGCELKQIHEALEQTPDARLLVLSALGAHPDARAPRLRTLWDLEEAARATGRPVLTLRLAPLVGPSSPFWLRLRSRPSLPESRQALLNPVIEGDVIETLRRAVRGEAEWWGWFEVAGQEALTLEELASLAARLPPLPRGAGSWEPPPGELREHRLAEAAPWSQHFGLEVGEVTSQSVAWS